MTAHEALKQIEQLEGGGEVAMRMVQEIIKRWRESNKDVWR